jgi:uncharacterized protein YkwD
MRALLLFAVILIGGLAGLMYWSESRVDDPSRMPDIERPADPRPRLPPTAPVEAGGPLRYRLARAPAENYGPSPADERGMRALVARSGAEHDGALSRAAQELARFYAQEGELLPSTALGFLLDAGGASAWGVRQAVVITNQTGDGAITDAIDEHLGPSDFAWQVGVGEARRRGQRVIAVLLAHRTHLLAPVARRWSSGDVIALQGRLLGGMRDPKWVVMRPDLSVFEQPVEGAPGRFDTRLTVDTPGAWTAELVATGAHGPTPLTQLTFHVDEPLPRTLDTIWPPDEAEFETPEAAADQAARLLNADRGRFGLPPLQRDADLDAIARAHSEDMRSRGFVGHVSPTTGGPSDRIKAAGWKAAISAENVALNRSLWDAEAGLLRSLGHRRNILSSQLTHVGLGAVRQGPNWYVTQLFALPPPRIDDIPAARQTLRDVLAKARKAAGVKRLRVRKTLRRVAQREARRAEPTPRHALDQASAARITGKVSAWVGKMSTLSQFEPEGGLLSDEFAKVGLGVHQAEDDQIRVVILLAQ